MKYLCLIFYDEKNLNSLSSEDYDQLADKSLSYDDVLGKGGHFLAGHALQPVDAATTVRLRSNKVAVTDGPFAETKEQIGGFILIDAPDLDEAISLASGIPVVRLGGVELRPIKELTGSGHN